MTEQQADALMDCIETKTKILEAQQKAGISTMGCELELAALTALCRHRDGTIYSQLIWHRPFKEVRGFDNI